MSEQPTIHPARCNALAHFMGRLVLSIAGWSRAGSVPAAQNIVVIAAPHTSNWDFILLMAAAYSFHIRINWLGKKSLFFFPLGYLLKFMGGIPVDRSKPNNLVQLLASRIDQDKGVSLVVPPSGTRGYTDHWKSGFYRIAEATRIPIVCGYLDYDKKEAGLGPAFLTSDVKTDMDRIRAFYGPIAGKYPERKSLIRLREEDY
jgi:1-acyl-sn-glycerol-3-phosphate acyltransferase